jgi:membrane protease YdiL (CAAX protease family)
MISRRRLPSSAITFCVSFVLAAQSFANAATPSSPAPEPATTSQLAPWLNTLYPTPREAPRAVFWPAFGSFLLPGLDQWWEGQYAAGALYTGYGVGGLVMAQQAAQSLRDQIRSGDSLTSRDPAVRRLMLGGQAYQAAGFMSAFHSFRSSRHDHPSHYDFMSGANENSLDLALAPLRFDYMSRWTTLVPLGIGAALAGALVATAPQADRGFPSLADWGFTTAVSFHAGVTEEAFFRGFLFPYIMAETKNRWFANALSSAVFAVAHLSDGNRYPVIQMVGGVYWAWITERNNWNLSEAIFQHFWWDVLIFSAAFAADQKAGRASSVFIPLIQTDF